MRTETKEKLRVELARLAGNPYPRVQRLLMAMAARYPFLFSSLEKTG